MLNDPLVHAFESGTVRPEAFHHREHLYVAWCYLRSLSLEEALARYVRSLRELVALLGVPHKFHATITWGYLVLVNEAIQACPEATFDELLTRNPSLLEPNSGALRRYYDRSQLESAEARQRFVLPRRP